MTDVIRLECVWFCCTMQLGIISWLKEHTYEHAVVLISIRSTNLPSRCDCGKRRRKATTRPLWMCLGVEIFWQRNNEKSQKKLEMINLIIGFFLDINHLVNVS